MLVTEELTALKLKQPWDWSSNEIKQRWQKMPFSCCRPAATIWSCCHVAAYCRHDNGHRGAYSESSHLSQTSKFDAWCWPATDMLQQHTSHNQANVCMTYSCQYLPAAPHLSQASKCMHDVVSIYKVATQLLQAAYNEHIAVCQQSHIQKPVATEEFTGTASPWYSSSLTILQSYTASWHKAVMHLLQAAWNEHISICQKSSWVPVTPESSQVQQCKRMLQAQTVLWCKAVTHLLQAAYNEHITICHKSNGWVPATAVHVVHHWVWYGVRVKHANGLDSADQKVTVQIQWITCKQRMTIIKWIGLLEINEQAYWNWVLCFLEIKTFDTRSLLLQGQYSSELSTAIWLQSQFWVRTFECEGTFFGRNAYIKKLKDCVSIDFAKMPWYPH